MTDYLGDKSLEELGLVMLQGYQHPFPSTRDRILAIPGRHGNYDFGATLDSRYFDLPVVLQASNESSLQFAIRTLSNHLFDAYGKPKVMKLIFSEEPDKFYWVRYSGNAPIQRVVGLGIFNLPLVAHDPFAHFILPSDEITMGSDVPIMSDILWGTGITNMSIKTPQTISIANNGSQVVRLSYLLEGSGNNVTLSANGKSFSFGSFTGRNWIVNGEKYTVLNNSMNGLPNITGEFIELFPGMNELSFNGTNLNLTFSEGIVYKYI